MAEQNQQQQQQNQQQQITPDVARSFLSEYVGEDSIKDIKDEAQLLSLHGTVSKAVEKAKGSGGFTDDWRENYVKRVTNGKGDEKLLGRLKRYSSPDAALDAMVGLQNKISAGELRSLKAYPDKGTDDEKAAWRKEQGLPAKPDDYKIALRDGLVIGEADKPRVKSFTEAAHALNAPPEIVSGVLNWYYDQQEKDAAALYEQDDRVREETENVLRAEMGADYPKNKKTVEAWLDTGPKGMKDLLFGARLADGTPLASNPDIVRFMVTKARDEFGDSVVLPAEGASMMASITDEVNAMRALMADKNSKYWKGPESAAMQKRYRDLVEQQSKLESRGKGQK